jgi:2-polyprenyl-3-methyl-5-hydroxy-6-metoxy-1,4-benzoquinol methylase
MDDYIKINRELWNKKTPVHVASKFYDVEGFIAGKTSLNPAELEALGDVKGKSLLHLQCHFGQDTLSWARLGADVTGVDLSDKAIEEAKKLNDKLGLNAEFICSNVYDLKEHLDKKFDIVFTSYGTIGWLPDLNKWAEIITYFLKPGGTFFIAEFHPVLWMFNEEFTGFQYSYFNDEAIVETVKNTYTDGSTEINLLSYGWNHPLSDIFTPLLNYGFNITEFREFRYSYYNCFNHAIRNKEGWWEIEGMEGKIPLMYSIKAIKN